MRRATLGPEPETMRRWLAFLRIVVGGLYLYAFGTKLTSGFPLHLPTELQSFTSRNGIHLVQRLLERVVLPHPQLFAWVILIAELVAGVLLLLGLGTRLIAAAAIILQVIYLLATFGSGLLVLLVNFMFIAALMVIFGTDGGWRWSLDEMIMNRR